MAAAKANSTRDLTAEVGFLTRALKAPTLREGGRPPRQAGPRGVLVA